MVKNVIPKHLEATTAKLVEIGCESISEKDSARRNYISALYNYWSLYYTLRSMTLYDFERNTILTEDYHLLIE